MPDDNAGSVHDKLMEVGADLVVKTVEMILSGNVKTIPQSELIKPGTILKPAPKIFKEDCRLDFSKDGITIKNLVRGLSPYPTAFTTIKVKDKDMSLKVFAVDFEPSKGVTETGKLFTDNKTFIKISCADGYIQLLDIQLEGKKRMGVVDFLRGVKL